MSSSSSSSRSSHSHVDVRHIDGDVVITRNILITFTLIIYDIKTGQKFGKENTKYLK